ncbi:MAG: BrxA/BrxB family bacilliredoxin [Armatimonadetes bacterium]|nr:BrxA/BrxB family bacilliredoxin [Armatimonadota bacterium]
MSYDANWVQPMRDELTGLGIKELKTPEEVDEVLSVGKGTVLVVVNSVCGCAAGNARPAVAMALKHEAVPDTVVTVFAGQDLEATARARSYFEGYPPSSPSVALLKDGKMAAMVERQEIEGRSPREIAGVLTEAFDRFCTRRSAAVATGLGC